MAPNDVNNESESEVFRNIYRDSKSLNYKYKFKKGDNVRITSIRTPFAKGYEQKWSREIFVVKNRYPSNPLTYSLKDLRDENIKGKFYEQELQKVTKDDNVYEVEKIIRTRKNKKV